MILRVDDEFQFELNSEEVTGLVLQIITRKRIMALVNGRCMQLILGDDQYALSTDDIKAV